jgi:DNA replication and repair protein RecF
MHDIAANMTAALRQTRTEDMYRGSSGVGIHREDIALTLMGREMKLFASQGQIRTAALSMKLAQLEIFRNLAGESPVLLLDDVMSELDMTRRTHLMEEIDGVQTFVTCTDASDLEGSMEKRSYQVRMQDTGIAGINAMSEGEAYETAPEDDEPDFT